MPRASTADGELVPRALVREERGRDLADDAVAEVDAQVARVRDDADLGVGQLPALEHLGDVREPLRRDGGDHPLLALGDHDLPRLHAGLAQRHAVQVDVDTGPVARHLGQRRRETGRAAVLERLDEAALDQLQRDLDQPVARERVADLHRGSLLRGALAELLARQHAGAADAVAAGRRAVEDEDVAGGRRARARHALGGQEADAHRVDEAVVGVLGVEDGLAAHGGDADGVSVGADAGDGAVEVVVRRAEAQQVEQRDRPRPHGRDVAQDPADARRRPLERLDGGGVVVALDLERHGLALAEVEDAGVLARPLQHALARRGQALQQQRRVLVAAVLAPEQREDRQLEMVRVSLEQLADALQLPVGEAEGPMQRLLDERRQSNRV